VSEPRGIVVVGSTGSIGRQALDVIRSCPNELRLVGIGARQNIDLLSKQVDEFGPRFVSAPAIPVGSTWHGARATTLGELCEVAEAERVLVATVGASGLRPTLAAIRAGKSVAIANKEVLVMAGDLVMAEAQRHQAEILPVDSEHNAVWQCLFGDCSLEIGRTTGPIARIVLTASGGAFRDLSVEQLAAVTRDQALIHPNWVMGPKVTIDSATLMNKGFEVIEAHWLFGIPYSQIDVLLHRESVVHALVEFVDGSFRAALGPPDMRLPVQHALTYPNRLPGSWPRLRLEQVGRLSFAALDRDRYPCFGLALAAAQAGGTAPAVLSAADDIAVQAFLDHAIAFNEISKIVDRALQEHHPIARPSFEEIVDADERTRAGLTARLGLGTAKASAYSGSLASTTWRG
jgi:1-deoxy-D-xylulose-5-phosphate reductoisomerase